MIPWKRIPLQYSFLKPPMDRGAWWDTVCGVSKELDTTKTNTTLWINYTPIKIRKKEMQTFRWSQIYWVRIFIVKRSLWLSWWLSGKESTCKCRGHRFLIREDPTGCGATKPMCCNYWACALEPWSCNTWSLIALDPILCNKRSHRNEKPSHRS